MFSLYFSSCPHPGSGQLGHQRLAASEGSHSEMLVRDSVLVFMSTSWKISGMDNVCVLRLQLLRWRDTRARARRSAFRVRLCVSARTRARCSSSFSLT